MSSTADRVKSLIEDHKGRSHYERDHWLLCEESAKEIRSAIYDPNGNSMTYGDVAALVNELQDENHELRGELENAQQSSEPEITMEMALIRWSVVHQRWSELGSGHMPYLPAFLAGWCCRAIGTSEPSDVGQYRDSFRAGWKEAGEQIVIASR